VTENTAPAGAGPADPAGPGAPERAPRRLRADAQRNIGSLLEAAKAVFGTSGVDAPAKEIAARGLSRLPGPSRRGTMPGCR
jgi:hypothetical protein